MEKKKRVYQRCIKCMMDTTDSKITFDDRGVCDTSRLLGIENRNLRI